MNNVSASKRDASHESDKGKETAAGVADKAKEMASGVADKAKDMASGVVGQVKDMASSAGQAVAGALETGGKYLEDKNISGMADDLTELIKRNPIPALLLGVGLGFLLARTFRS